MQDLIEELLSRLQLRTRVFHQGRHCGKWSLDLPNSRTALFHLVLEGRCVIESPDGEDIRLLSSGDMVLFSRPGKHRIRAVDDNFKKNQVAQAFEFHEKAGEDSTGLICGHVEFDSVNRNPLLEAMPDHVIVRADAHPRRDWLKHLFSLLIAEATGSVAASQSVIERLTDVLFIHALRSHLAASPGSTGILAAYRDPGLRATLEAIHNSPEKRWNLVLLADVANSSRSAFVDRFSRVLGMPPMTYLTQHRLERAYRKLREGRTKILEIAIASGYESEASFCKAFKRLYGVSPGRVKRALS